MRNVSGTRSHLKRALVKTRTLIRSWVFLGSALKRQRLNRNTVVCGVSGGNSQLLSHITFTLSPSALNEDKTTDWIYSLFQLSASSHIRLLLLQTYVRDLNVNTHVEGTDVMRTNPQRDSIRTLSNELLVQIKTIKKHRKLHSSRSTRPSTKYVNTRRTSGFNLYNHET